PSVPTSRGEWGAAVQHAERVAPFDPPGAPYENVLVGDLDLEGGLMHVQGPPCVEAPREAGRGVPQSERPFPAVDLEAHWHSANHGARGPGLMQALPSPCGGSRAWPGGGRFRNDWAERGPAGRGERVDLGVGEAPDTAEDFAGVGTEARRRLDVRTTASRTHGRSDHADRTKAVVLVPEDEATL